MFAVTQRQLQAGVSSACVLTPSESMQCRTQTRREPPRQRRSHRHLIICECMQKFISSNSFVHHRRLVKSNNNNAPPLPSSSQFRVDRVSTAATSECDGGSSHASCHTAPALHHSSGSSPAPTLSASAAFSSVVTRKQHRCRIVRRRCAAAFARGPSLA